MNPWIADGHRLIFIIDMDTIKIGRVACPHDGGGKGKCNQGRDFCLVKRFLGVYQLEACVGSCTVSGPVEIAWMPVYGESDLDNEVGGVYCTPIEDERYQKILEDERFNTLA